MKEKTKEKFLQLNEEPVGSINNKVVKHQKEENSMKRTRKFLAIVASLIFVMSVLAGCEKGSGSGPSTAIGSSAEPTVQAPTEAAPTAAPEVTEAVEPTVEATPTEEVEAPTEAADPNIIDGIDFTEYNNGEAPINKPVATMNYDTIRVVASTEHGREGLACAILADGDSFTMEPEKIYWYVIYLPKKAEAVEKLNPDNIDYLGAPMEYVSDDGVKYDGLFGFALNREVTGEDVEVGFLFKYTDGTEESITMHFDKQYVGGCY